MAKKKQSRAGIERLVAYSKKPYFGTSLPVGAIAESIEIRIDATNCTLLTGVDDENCVTEMNLTGLDLVRGDVITYDNYLKAATFSEVVKFNLI
jgi:hypothetical protein